MKNINSVKEKNSAGKLLSCLSYINLILILTLTTLIIQIFFVDKVSLTVNILLGISLVFIGFSVINGSIAEQYLGQQHPSYFSGEISGYLIISALFNILSFGFLLYFGFDGGTGWYSIVALAVAIFYSIKVSFSLFNI